MTPTLSCWALLKQQYELYVQPLSVCVMIGGLTGSLDNGNPAATSSPRKSRHCSHFCLRAHHLRVTLDSSLVYCMAFKVRFEFCGKGPEDVEAVKRHCLRKEGG